MITTILEWFAFGGVLFWISVATSIVFLIALSECNRHFTKLLLVATTALLFAPQLKTLSTTQYIIIGVCYLIAGLIYSLLKWHLNVSSIVDKNKELLKRHNIQKLDDIDVVIKNIRAKLRKFSDDYSHIPKWSAEIRIEYEQWERDKDVLASLLNEITPNVNKARIYNWTLHWPWSILRMLTADLAESLYQLFKSQYVRIVDSVLSSNIK